MILLSEKVTGNTKECLAEAMARRLSVQYTDTVIPMVVDYRKEKKKKAKYRNLISFAQLLKKLAL